MIIREMQEVDLPQVVQLEEAVFSKPWSEKSFRDAYMREDTIYLVAEDKNIIGYCGIWCMAEDGDLCNIAVATAWRRQGVGRKLLEEAFGCCRRRQMKRILLEVRASNEPAKRMYQKILFREIGRRKGYYSEPLEDAVIMECFL